jgi:hypothetical protein
MRLIRISCLARYRTLFRGVNLDVCGLVAAADELILDLLGVMDVSQREELEVRLTAYELTASDRLHARLLGFDPDVQRLRFIGLFQQAKLTVVTRHH